jgi:hypothetical protein
VDSDDEYDDSNAEDGDKENRDVVKPISDNKRQRKEGKQQQHSDTEVDEPKPKSYPKRQIILEDSDTDVDEPPPEPEEEATDIDEPLTASTQALNRQMKWNFNPPLPDIFVNDCFILVGISEKSLNRSIRNRIIVYGGEVVDNPMDANMAILGDDDDEVNKFLKKNVGPNVRFGSIKWFFKKVNDAMKRP